MKLHLLRELDLFGTDIKWRFLSKDNFKSYFGALITLIIVGLFGVKLFFFIQKTSEYGFAKNKINFHFKDDFQFLNMSDLRVLVYTNLDEKLDKFKGNTSTAIKNRSYFNLSDYIDIYFYEYVDIKRNNTLVMGERDCATSEKFAFMKDMGTVEELAYFKCLAFKDNQDYLNTTKTQTFLPKFNGEPSSIQLNSLSIFYLEFSMKDILVNFLKSTKQSFYLTLTFSNFIPNPQTFELEESFSTIYLPIDLNFEIEAEITFNKLSVTKKYEFDIFELEFSDYHKFQVSPDSFNIIKNSRENFKLENGNKIIYRDFLSFKYEVFEENNEVTFLTLDDILAVLGGFMQIVFTGAEIFAGFYNEQNGESIIWKYCMENYHNYDKTIMNVRNNVEMQMDYYKTYLRRKQEGKKYHENKIDKRSKDRYIKYDRDKLSYKNQDGVQRDCFNDKEDYENNNYNNNNFQDENKQNPNGSMNQNQMKLSDENLFKHYKQMQNQLNVNQASDVASNDNEIVRDRKGRTYNSNDKLIKNSLNDNISEEYKGREKKISDRISTEKKTIDGDENTFYQKTKEKITDPVFSHKMESKDLNSKSALIEGIERNKNNLNGMKNYKFNKTDLNLNRPIEGNQDFPIYNKISYITPIEEENMKIPGANDSYLMKNDQNIELKNVIVKLNNFDPETISIRNNSNNQIEQLRNKLDNLENNADNFNEEYKEQKDDQKSSQIKPKKTRVLSATRKSKFLEETFDFLELISIDRYLTLLSGFEAFKFFYFNELNKFNFENFSDLFIYSQNYRFNNFDVNTFVLNEKTLPKDATQIEIFEKFIDNLNKY